MRLILTRIWFFARPLVLGAARVQENWFSLSFIAPPPCHTWPRGQQAVFAELVAVFANRRVVGGRWRLLGAVRVETAQPQSRLGLGPRAQSPPPVNAPQGIGLVDEVAERALQFQSFGGEGAGGFDAAGVLLAQSLNPSGGQREFLASDALHFGYPWVGIEVGYGEKLAAGLFDRVFHAQPVEQRALGLLLAGGDFDQAPNEMGSHRRPALSHL